MWVSPLGQMLSLKTHIYVCFLLFVGYKKKVERKKNHYFDFNKYCILGAFSLKVLEENKFDCFVSFCFDFLTFLVHGF